MFASEKVFYSSQKPSTMNCDGSVTLNGYNNTYTTATDLRIGITFLGLKTNLPRNLKAEPNVNSGGMLGKKFAPHAMATRNAISSINLNKREALMDFNDNLILMALRSKIFKAECTMHGMVAENKIREMKGESPAYNEDSFQVLIEEFKREIALFNLNLIT